MRMGRLRKGLLTIADQGICSASNLLLSIAIASQVSAASFGVFAIVYAIYYVLLGAVRAYCFEAMLVLRSGDNDRGGSAAAALILSTLIGLVASLAGGAAWLVGLLSSPWAI